ncbi:unnamed protein product [Strongylus vulgaris]|uniref:MULE transposase domain-containing protein n=1 Tax=Strongylus vulgaris TaxID=40348 RepID=A0A3P7IRK5_STRVU|nr:unnamed protein product [Strongylus vulgaris]
MRSPTIKQRSRARCTDILSSWFMSIYIKVIDDEFQTDPCMLPHHCIPKEIKTNYVERYLYQKLQSQEEVEEIMDKFHQTGYGSRRRTIAKSLEKHDRPRATLDSVPEDLRTLTDGSLFLQFSQPGLYIYFSRRTLQKAVDNGMTAIVADGIHRLPPEELGKDGQLYTIHGVCNGGVDVPLVHVLTKKKNLSVYEKVFSIVKQQLLALGVDLQQLRILIDFERAALAALRVSALTK